MIERLLHIALLILHLQRIQYAKSKSDIVSKLDGTYMMPGSTVVNVEMNEAQQSIFNAPAPGTSSGQVPAPPRGLPVKPPATERDHVDSDAPSRGQKRTREEEDEEQSDEDVAMEEDSDDE
jgi:U2 small nuclear ribonucleoprotein B''